MKELLEQAAQFLKDHPEINEVELSNGRYDKVHLVRFTPTPVPYTWWAYSQTFPEGHP